MGVPVNVAVTWYVKDMVIVGLLDSSVTVTWKLWLSLMLPDFGYVTVLVDVMLFDEVGDSVRDGPDSVLVTDGPVREAVTSAELVRVSVFVVDHVF